MYRYIPVILVVVVLALGGCASQQDLNALKWEVNDLQTKVSRMEKEQRSDYASLKKQSDQLFKNQAELESHYTDLMTQIMEMQGKIDVLASDSNKTQGDKEEIKRLRSELASIKEYLGMTTGKKPSLYDLGLKEFKDKRYDRAIRFLDQYVKANPGQPKAGDAYFFIAESLYAEGKYEDAILAYDTVVKRYKESKKVAQCLFKEAMAFLKLKDRETANLILKRLIRKYPGSAQAKEAEKMLKKVR